MKIEIINGLFTVCQLKKGIQIDINRPFTFVSRTDEELSLVCPTEDVPKGTFRREDGWQMMRIAGKLEFSEVGILARLSALMASASIPIFAVSTYNTDYILVKDTHIDRAVRILSEHWYDIKML